MSNTLSIPNTFVDGTDALAADVNANFSAVSTFVNSTKLNDDNLKTGGVGTASIADSAVTTAKIADSNVTTAKIADANVTTAKIADDSITAAKVEDNINLPGDTVKENGKMVVVSNTNAAKSLEIVRGSITSGGVVSVGEGFSSSRGAAGQFTVTFTTAFGSTPTVTAIGSSGQSTIVSIASLSTTQVSFFCYARTDGSYQDTAIQFIAIGPRA